MPSVIIGFAGGPTFIGRAACMSDEFPTLCPRQLYGFLVDREEYVLVGNWIRRSIAKSGAQAVGLFVEDPERPSVEAERAFCTLVEQGAKDLGIPILEVRRGDLVGALGIDESSDAGICRELAKRFEPIAGERAPPWTRRTSMRKRSQTARYWEMPTVALGAALVAQRFFCGSSDVL